MLELVSILLDQFVELPVAREKETQSLLQFTALVRRVPFRSLTHVGNLSAHLLKLDLQSDLVVSIRIQYKSNSLQYALFSCFKAEWEN